MKKSRLTALFTVLVLLLGGCSSHVAKKNSFEEKNEKSSSSSKTKEERDQESFYSSTEARMSKNEKLDSKKAKIAEKAGITAFSSKYVTYTLKNTTQGEVYGVNPQFVETKSTGGRLEYAAYQFLPNHEAYWMYFFENKPESTTSYTVHRGTYQIVDDEIRYKPIPTAWFHWKVKNDVFIDLWNGDNLPDSKEMGLTISNGLGILEEYPLSEGKTSNQAKKALSPIVPEIVSSINTASMDLAKLYSEAESKYNEVGKLKSF